MIFYWMAEEKAGYVMFKKLRIQRKLMGNICQLFYYENLRLREFIIIIENWTIVGQLRP